MLSAAAVNHYLAGDLFSWPCIPFFGLFFIIRFEEVFYKMSVDIVVQGHEHNYERLWPVYRNNVTEYTYNNPSAPVQLISGAAGSAENVDHFPAQKRRKYNTSNLIQ